jgi:uncharacterized protein
LKVRLDQVRHEPFFWQETCDFPVESLHSPELVALSPVTWRGQVVFAEPDFLLKGRVAYEQTLTCTRCLKQFVEPVKGDVQLMLRLAGREEQAGGERELKESELGVVVVSDEVVELSPLLAEQLQLNLPMKPLCRPDCLGLCPRCGADRNEGPCDCAEPVADARWGTLAGLKDRLQRDEAKTD